MGTVRAKFKVDAIEMSKSGVDTIGTVKLSPVYSNDPESENAKFFKWTPSGRIELGVIRQETLERFPLGHEFYVDFTPAPAAPK